MNYQKPTTYRTDRISELIRRELVLLFAHKVCDSRLQLIRITEVIVSKDLSSAKVFFNIADNPEMIKKPLEKAKHFFRHHLANALELRHMPELKFIYDPTQTTANRIDDLLAKL